MGIVESKCTVRAESRKGRGGNFRSLAEKGVVCVLVCGVLENFRLKYKWKRTVIQNGKNCL